MDLEAEFYKETEMQAYNRLLGRYTPYYVEWLEERLELEIIKKIT
jgi:hypothetical protein